VKCSKRIFYDRSLKSNDKDDRDLTTANDGKPRVSALSYRYRMESAYTIESIRRSIVRYIEAPS